MKLSVIIVNYNVRYFLEPCLQSVQDALVDIDSEIIVVDNNSPDDSCKMVEKKFPDVTLIANTENYGFAKANNQGVSKARGQYVLILNPDTIVDKDTFTKILDFAKTRHNFGALGVKLIDGKGAFLSESKRGIPTPTVSFYKLIGFTSKRTGKYYANHLKENEIGIIEILVGAFMLMTRKVYKEVKGFDESYFMYGEDIDLSYKILNKGYQNYYYPDTHTIHYKGESTIKNALSLRHFHQAMEIFYREHFKINKVYDFFMRLGIEFWYLLKFFGLKKKVKPDELPDIIAYFGTDKQVYNKIKTVSSKVTFFQYSDIKNMNRFKAYVKEKKIKEVIFDNNDVSYHKIIAHILALKETGLTFKIKPRNCNYFFGSNNSESRGEVITF
ncbi:MAG: glycosyltransferase family 2 protein [Urechidicola sp.]|nr:glycosyltransferase family 2 protein [Urechidicola sp.]